jgi:hypothetical protein
MIARQRFTSPGASSNHGRTIWKREASWSAHTALGLNPTVEAVAAQLAVIVIAVVTIAVLDRRARQATAKDAASRAA